jgi:hypothetical protein
MKHLIYLCCLATATIVVSAENEKDTSGGPRITFEDTRHDFGTVDPAALKWTFKFKNTGDKTLEVKNVQPGCGCTVAEVEVQGKKAEKKDGAYLVEPGQEGAITAQLNAGTMKGHVEKGITVTSNDPKNPSVHLAIVAMLKVDVTVLPQPSLWLNKLQPDTVTNQTLEIHSELAEPLVVEKVESSVPWLTVKVGETTTNSAKIQISTKPPIPSGTQRATVTAHTKYQKYTNVVINITSQILPTISAVPGRLVFLKNKDQKPADVSVLVMRNDGKDFQIKGIQTDSPQINDILTTNQPGRSYSVNVKYLPKEGQEATSGKLVILTDEPTTPKLEIPYSVR